MRCCAYPHTWLRISARSSFCRCRSIVVFTSALPRSSGRLSRRKRMKCGACDVSPQPLEIRTRWENSASVAGRPHRLPRPADRASANAACTDSSLWSIGLYRAGRRGMTVRSTASSGRRSWMDRPKKSRAADATPSAWKLNGTWLRYSSRMRFFGRRASRRRASHASPAFPCHPSPRRLIMRANCMVIVDAPETVLPPFGSG